MRHPLATSLLAIAAAAMAGCGGGEGGAAADANATPQSEATKPFTGTTVQSSMDYVNQLIGQTSETSEPEPVDDTPLPTDDSV